MLYTSRHYNAYLKNPCSSRSSVDVADPWKQSGAEGKKYPVHGLERLAVQTCHGYSVDTVTWLIDELHGVMGRA